MVASPSLAFIAIDLKAILPPFHTLHKHHDTGTMLNNEAMAEVMPLLGITAITSVLLTPDLSEPGTAHSLLAPQVSLQNIRIIRPRSYPHTVQV